MEQKLEAGIYLLLGRMPSGFTPIYSLGPRQTWHLALGDTWHSVTFGTWSHLALGHTWHSVTLGTRSHLALSHTWHAA